MATERAKLQHQALRHWKRGQWAKALAAYERILAQRPQDAATRLKVGDVLLRAGRRYEALQAWLTTAEQYRRAGLLLKAAAIQRRVVGLAPEAFAHRLRLAADLQRAERPADALTELTRAARMLGPQAGDDQRTALLELGAEVFAACGLAARAAAATRQLAVLRAAAGDDEAARALQQRALELAPAAAENSIACEEERLEALPSADSEEEPPDAEPTAEFAAPVVELEPEATAEIDLEIDLDAPEPDAPPGAEPSAEPSAPGPTAPERPAAARAAADGPPAHTELEAELPAADDFQYDPQDVLAAFREGVARTVDPRDGQTHRDLGIAYREMGLLDEAIEAFELAARQPRQRIASLALLADCLVAAGRAREAICQAMKALHQPGLTTRPALDLYHVAARAYEQLGDAETATRLYRKITRRDPTHHHARERLAALGATGPS